MSGTVLFRVTSGENKSNDEQQMSTQLLMFSLMNIIRIKE